MLHWVVVYLSAWIFPASTAFVIRRSTSQTLRTSIPFPRPANSFGPGITLGYILFVHSFLLPAMGRNTAGFSAFSIFVWALFGLNIILIAFALFYESSWYWACSMIVSLTLFNGRRVFTNCRVKLHTRSSLPKGKWNRRQYSEPTGMPDSIHMSITPNEQGISTLLPTQYRAVMPVHRLLPGLPPVCLN